MTQRATLEMTAGDNDSFLVTLTDVDLTTASSFGIEMRRPTTPLAKAGIDDGELASGQFLIFFDSDTDLVAGNEQAVDVTWTIAGVVLTSKEHFYINVKEAII